MTCKHPPNIGYGANAGITIIDSDHHYEEASASAPFSYSGTPGNFADRDRQSPLRTPRYKTRGIKVFASADMADGNQLYNPKPSLIWES